MTSEIITLWKRRYPTKLIDAFEPFDEELTRSLTALSAALAKAPEEVPEMFISLVELHAGKPWNSMSPRERATALVNWLANEAEGGVI